MESAPTIVQGLTSAFQTCANDAVSAITSIVPIALPVLTALVVVGVGIKTFKKVTGR